MGYRATLARWLGGQCRYHPTCSAYAIEALRTHGAVRGGWMSARRVLRCHPWGGSGYDPVPPRPESRRRNAETAGKGEGATRK